MHRICSISPAWPLAVYGQNGPSRGLIPSGRTLAVSFSGRARKSAQCGRGSRARASGAQQVSATVAPLSPLEARRRDLSTIGPNGARRRCPTAGQWTLNGRFNDELHSSPLHSSRNTSYTRRPVSLGSRYDVSRPPFAFFDLWLCHPLTGPQRGSAEHLPSHCGGVGRRAVGLRGCKSFLGVRTRPTVAGDRSARTYRNFPDVM